MKYTKPRVERTVVVGEMGSAISCPVGAICEVPVGR